MSTELSVVMPAYNEADNLEPLLARTFETLESTGDSHEIIVVDNGSNDRSAPLLSQLIERYPNLRVVSLTRNFGYDGAIAAGLDHSRGNWVVIMDADQQDPPEEIPRFVEKAREGFPVVYGIREKRTEGAILSTFIKAFYRLWKRIADIEIPVDAGNFGVMHRDVVNIIKGLPETRKNLRGLRAWTGFESAGLPYERSSRDKGNTKFSFGRYVTHALDGITSFSTAPLRMFTYGGLAGIAACALLALIFIGSKFLEILGIPILPYRIDGGFTTLALLVLSGVSANLFGLGIIGEYVGRCLEEGKGRPTYVIRQVTGRDDAADQ